VFFIFFHKTSSVYSTICTPRHRKFIDRARTEREKRRENERERERKRLID